MRFIIYFLIILIGIQPLIVFSQSSIRYKDKLYIEPVGVGIINPGLFGTHIYETWNQWQAYKGTIKISEEEFFKITGYPEEAKAAKEFYIKNSKTGLIGAILIFGGLLLIITGFNNKSEKTEYIEEIEITIEESDYTQVYWGAAITGVGSFFLYNSAQKTNLKLAPFGMVKQIADEYNARLDSLQIDNQ